MLNQAQSEVVSEAGASIPFEKTSLFASSALQTQPIRISVGSAGLIGPRRTMEDASFSVSNFPAENGSGECSFFGILDGHGGSEIALFAAERLPTALFANNHLGRDNARALVESIAFTDKEIYLNDTQKKMGGSCAITALVFGRSLCVGNLGDSRAVLCDQGRAVPLSTDHKPSDPTELERVKRCGGTVTGNRINGMLNVSRAIGDYGFKFQGTEFDQRDFKVSNVADICEVNISDSTPFLVLACDGLWDVMSSEDVIQWILQFVRDEKNIRESQGSTKKLLGKAAHRLCETAIERGSLDNVSVTIVGLHDTVA